MSVISPIKHILKNSKKVILRTAETGDAGELLKMKKDATAEGKYMLREENEFENTVESDREAIEGYIEGEGSIYIVAELEEKIIGFITFDNGSFKRTKHSGMLFMIVKEGYREKGVGTLLLGALVKWAEDNPIIEKLTLAVFSINERAYNLYRKLGFKEEGRCPRDMKLEDGTYIDSVLMYKFLNK